MVIYFGTIERSYDEKGLFLKIVHVHVMWGKTSNEKNVNKIKLKEKLVFLLHQLLFTSI